MTITKRLILTLSTALLALLFVGFGGLWQLQRAQQRLDTVQDKIIPSIHGLYAAKGYLADTRLAGYRLAVFSNLSDKTALSKSVADTNKAFDDVSEPVRKTPSQPRNGEKNGKAAPLPASSRARVDDMPE